MMIARSFLIFVFLLGVWIASASISLATDFGTSYETGGVLPAVLSEADEGRYQKIFEVQESGSWKTADRLISKLDNKILLGHVLSQRYLHPNKYRSKYKELKGWMAEYADHPQAPRLYKLALKRRPANWKKPKSPVTLKTLATSSSSVRKIKFPTKRRTKAETRWVRTTEAKIRRSTRRGHTLVVKNLLSLKKTQKLFSAAEYDRSVAKLALGYFTDGRDEWALKWAGDAARRSGKYVPEAHWTAGLAAWRLGKIDTAATHFEQAALLSDGGGWFHSGAAFWAARAHLVNRNPAKVHQFLEMAAVQPRTFYGLLAGRLLGRKMNFEWKSPALQPEVIEALQAEPRGVRAMALMQVGQMRLAERELRNIARGADEKLGNGLLALASEGNMASLALRLDRIIFPNGGSFDGAAYPVPAWAPADGFRVDRALIYAVVRQESRFNPKAKSWAGARGLMQLMPRTASFVARDSGYRSGKRKHLFLPELNLRLGQKYIEMLFSDKKINGNLLFMAAAWNGGPGNLNKWRRRTDDLNDPLFFIESIPSRETRGFIEHVLSNFWIYRNRLRQPTPSLDAIASGEWPVYSTLGQKQVEVAENNGSRN